MFEWRQARKRLGVAGIGSPEGVGVWPHMVLAGIVFGEKHQTEVIVQTQPHDGKTYYEVKVYRKYDDVIEPGQTPARGPWPLRPQYASVFDELKRILPDAWLWYEPSSGLFNEPRIYLRSYQNGLAQDAGTIEAVVRPMIRCARRFCG